MARRMNWTAVEISRGTGDLFDGKICCQLMLVLSQAGEAANR
jgi:hypothetical protein